MKKLGKKLNSSKATISAYSGCSACGSVCNGTAPASNYIYAISY